MEQEMETILSVSLGTSKDAEVSAIQGLANFMDQMQELDTEQQDRIGIWFASRYCDLENH